MENWIETHSGLKVFVNDPKPEQFDIKDIGYALSNTCRFGGHCAGFLSVAEHSVLVAQRLPQDYKLAGLLHDASEAYLGDMPSPIKQFLPDFKKFEDLFTRVINEKFGLDSDDATMWGEVKWADMDALYTEAHFLIPSEGKEWAYFQNPAVNWKVRYDLKPVCLPPAYAYKLFMGMFYELTDDKRIVLL